MAMIYKFKNRSCYNVFMRSVILDPNVMEDLNKARYILKSGGLVALPTETVYGLAADMFNQEAFKSIFLVKKRPFSKALTVHVSEFSQVRILANSLCIDAENLIRKFWPGPLTVIVRASSKVPEYVTSGTGYIGIRFPKHETFKNVADRVGNPLVVTSANRSGGLSATKFEQVFEEFNGKVDAIFKEQKDTVQGLESTIVSFKEEVPKILRLGSVPYEKIKSVISKVKIETKSSSKKCDKEAIAINATSEDFSDYIKSRKNLNVAVLCFNEDTNLIPERKGLKIVAMGPENNSKELVYNFYNSVKKLSNIISKKDAIYIRLPKKEGLQFSLYKKLLEFFCFKEITL